MVDASIQYACSWLKGPVSSCAAVGTRGYTVGLPETDPALKLLRNLQGLIGAWIFYAQRAVVDDEAKMSGYDVNVEVGAVAVIAGELVVGCAKVAVGIGGCAVHVENPVVIVAVGPVVVDARLARRYGGVGTGGRARCQQGVAAGKLPELIALRGRVDVLVWPGILGVAVVQNDADVLRVRRDAYVEVGAEAIRAGDGDRAAGKVIGFGRVEEGVHGPAGVVAVRPKVVNADVAGGDGGCGLSTGEPGKQQADKNEQQ